LGGEYAGWVAHAVNAKAIAATANNLMRDPGSADNFGINVGIFVAIHSRFS
jgi:hypothetical protein